VFEAVKYSARFRLPPDFKEEEIDRRVEETLRDLGLEGVRNLQIGKPEKKILSGGQRKRVNIALELVTDPVILFLDEPTSGLAADDTTALVSLLAALTKKTGKTIVMTIHQPAKDEFEKFNLCFIMGYGGIRRILVPLGSTHIRFLALSWNGLRTEMGIGPSTIQRYVRHAERPREADVREASSDSPKYTSMVGACRAAKPGGRNSSKAIMPYFNICSRGASHR